MRSLWYVMCGACVHVVHVWCVCRWNGGRQYAPDEQQAVNRGIGGNRRAGKTGRRRGRGTRGELLGSWNL